MKIEEIRSKTDSELEFDLEKIERELFDLRFRAPNVPSPADIEKHRRTIARIKTILHERQTGVRGQEPK